MGSDSGGGRSEAGGLRGRRHTPSRADARLGQGRHTPAASGALASDVHCRCWRLGVGPLGGVWPALRTPEPGRTRPCLSARGALATRMAVWASAHKRPRQASRAGRRAGQPGKSAPQPGVVLARVETEQDAWWGTASWHESPAPPAQGAPDPDFCHSDALSPLEEWARSGAGQCLSCAQELKEQTRGAGLAS